MKHKKTIIAGILCLLLVLPLVSCLGRLETKAEGSTVDAYMFWKGASQQTCYMKFEGLNTGSVETGFPINYIDPSTIKDQKNSANEAYVWGADFEWVLSSTFEENSSNEQLLNLFSQDEDTMHQFTLPPSAGSDGANSIIRTFDNTFQIAILRPDYQSVAIDQAVASYHPSFLNEVLAGGSVDISATTKSNPAIYEVFFLESQYKLSAGTDSLSEKFVSVTPLDVPSQAVTVTETAAGSGIFTIVFHSNFYDRVVFEIKTEADNTYYVMLARTGLVAEGERFDVTATLYYPAAYNHNIYEVLVTLLYEDGTSEVKNAEAIEATDMFGNPTGEYEPVDEDSNLRFSQYQVTFDKDITDAYISVIQKNALSTTSFGGALCGSGRGAHFDPEERRIVYTN